MSTQQNVIPISENVKEREKLRKQLQRYINIYVKRYDLKAIENLVEFIDQWFYIDKGEVVVRSNVSVNEMEQKLLSNFRVVVTENFYVQPVLEHVVKKMDTTIDVPKCNMQSISVADPGVQYDYILEPFSERLLVKQEINENVYIIEQWDGKAVDCVYTTEDDLSRKPFHYRRSILKKQGIKLRPVVKQIVDGSMLIIDSRVYNQKGEGGYMEVVLGTQINVKKNIEDGRVDYLVRNVAGERKWERILSRDEVESDKYHDCIIRYDYATRQEVGLRTYVHSIIDWEMMQRNLRSVKKEDFVRLTDWDIEGVEVDIVFEGLVIGVGFRRQLYDMTLNKQMVGTIKNENKHVRFKLFTSLEIWKMLKTTLYRFATKMQAVMKINSENRRKKKISKWFVEIKI